MQSYREQLHDFKKQIILDAIEAGGGHQGGAAKLLGVHRNTINRLVVEVGLNQKLINIYLRARQRQLEEKKPCQSSVLHMKKTVASVSAAR